ncbi:integrase_H2C2 domain-containing protein [Trichonephila inaurata madagascariensis]|uniref:Integrase_H2C2 domain-containing protein n=1 Tax=Trichonephila inaurata madagascariensis TaxID=2747483 RepID=A0A8X6XHA7_9ARAC|nr:integrase_H2C2 domain-containing protein [Trichonephila inaurata madagascariensis]
MLTKCLIESVHRKNYHAGTQIMKSILREKFWIVKSRKTIRNVLNGRLKCKRCKAKPLATKSCPLPEDRVSDTVAFEVTGVDIVEPLFLSSSKEGLDYIAHFFVLYTELFIWNLWFL